ncbi:MAG: hypothetical protein EOP11_24425 [Proteobacteria bacterium]|nr:MAG: hypothetical protein EOP11_24425 [Pseudomonadota bacterium]
MPGTGGSVLPPVAHPLSATLLMPTLKPGSDLIGILGPHFGEAERIALADSLASAEAAHERQVELRVQALRKFLTGAHMLSGADPFLRWAAEAPDGLKNISKKVQRGRLSLARAEEELVALFPDWLSTGPTFAKEALRVKALNRALSEAYLEEESGPVERTLESLLLC